MTDGSDKALQWFRIGGYSSAPAPPISIDLRRPVPAWALRVVSAAVATGCVALLAQDRTRWVVGGLVVAMVLIRPAGGAPIALTLLTALWVLTGDPFAVALLPLLFGTHLVIVLTAAVGNLPWNGQLELSVLRAPLRRMLVVQAPAQLFAIAAWWVHTSGISSIYLQLLGACGIGVIAWITYARVREIA